MVLALGLAVILRYELPQAQGLEKALPWGRVLLAVSLAIFGGEHLGLAKAISGVVPRWIPGHLFWAYFVGVALIAAGISIATKKLIGLAATLLGIMIFCFVVLIHVPALVATPNRFTFTVLLRDLAFSAGALALATTQATPEREAMARKIATAARCLIGFVLVVFAVQHFLHSGFVPVVPLALALPAWVPLPWLWAYGVGAALLVAGVLLILNWHARLAAICLGLMIFAVILALYLPMLVQRPTDIGVAINYFADTLMFGSTVLVLASSIPKANHS